YQLASDQIQVDFKNALPQTVDSSGSVIPGEGVILFRAPADWRAATGASGGVMGHELASNVSGALCGSINDLLTIRPGLPPGVYRGISSTQAQSVIGTGLFVVSSLGSGANSLVRLRYKPTTEGG